MAFVTVLLFYPADFKTGNETLQCPQNANAGLCGLNFTGVALPNLPHCCCSEGFTPFGKWNRCSQCSTLNAEGKDCCGNSINEQNEPFISGTSQCLCNSKANAENVYIDEQCICATHYCGKFCQLYSEDSCARTVQCQRFRNNAQTPLPELAR